LLPAGINIPFVNQFLFHSEQGVQGAKGLSETVYRGWLWAQHISIFVQHPLFGIGSYDLNNLVDDRILGNQHDYAGTESLLTGLLSRVGLLALLLFAAIIAKLHQAVKLGEHAAAASGIAMIVMLISHGGLANTYNIEFLLLASGLSWRTSLMSRLTDKRVSESPG
jgi:O-antigen ligase